MYLGDFRVNSTVRGFFNSRKSNNDPVTVSGSPFIAVYKDGGVTESTAGTTLTVDFDSRTGLHSFTVDTASDGNFYVPHADYGVILASGMVDGVNIAGTKIAEFSIENRYALASRVWVKVSGSWV